jgi:UDP-N-acetylglucosamine 2-epimerase (non-hydrolysing)
MLDQVLRIFDIRPDYDLNLMQERQALTQVTAEVLTHLSPVIDRERPDWILIQGDTTTVMAAALAAYFHHAKIGHVEAGLRTWDKSHPFPEEINRRVADIVADLHFAPTDWARGNLLREGVADSSIIVTGNTVVDVLLEIACRPYSFSGHLAPIVASGKRLIVVTAHRRESFGEPFRQVCLALREIALSYARDVQLIYPVHLNPNVRAPVYEILADVPNILLLPPLEYVPLVHLLKRAFFVLTDSGGIQEEAPSFGVPVLVMRDVTERPEGVQAGIARLVGTDRDRIVAEAKRLLNDPVAYQQMAQVKNPYGDGHASERIVSALFETDQLKIP